MVRATGEKWKGKSNIFVYFSPFFANSFVELDQPAGIYSKRKCWSDVIELVLTEKLEKETKETRKEKSITE